jgi:hypothetical protein
VLATAWRRRFRRYPGDWVWPVVGLLIIAALAATVGILATHDNSSGTKTRAETQASVPLSTGTGVTSTTPTDTETAPEPTESVPTTAPEQPPPPPPSSNTLTEWPAGKDGWTIVLSSIPQSAGRPAAVNVARNALSAGLTDVGILDSSQYSSLHTGYFVVFTGIYDSENEARAALDAAQGSYPQSYVRQITQ